MNTPSMPDMNVAARKANAKLQRLENGRAKLEGREPVNLRERRRERFAADREARAALAATRPRIAELEELIRAETERIGKALTEGDREAAKAGARQRGYWRAELAEILDEAIGATA